MSGDVRGRICYHPGFCAEKRIYAVANTLIKCVGTLTGQAYTTQATWLSSVTSVMVVPHYMSHQTQLEA